MNANEDLRIVPLNRGAEMIGVSPRTIQRMAKSGALPTVRTGEKSGGRWVSITALRKFIEQGGVGGGAVTPSVYC